MNSRSAVGVAGTRPSLDPAASQSKPLAPGPEVAAAGSRFPLGRVMALGRRARDDPRRALRAALEEMAGLRVLGGSAEIAIRRLRTQQPRMFPLSEVLRVMDGIQAAGVPCWLAGGWGVDALTGGQIRVHGDLDLVLDDFEGSIGALSQVLERLGYRPEPAHQPGMWLPQAADFEASGHRIEVLGVNWAFLTSVMALVDPASDRTTMREAFRASCLAQGSLGARTVPCLSAGAQALFHTGYPGRETDRRDRALLTTLGQVTRQPDSAAVRTALLIPTFDLDARTAELWSRMNRAGTLPPHITLLFPFLPLSGITPEVRLRLAALFASESPFDYQLTRVGWFDRRVVYLEPDPRDGFTALISRLSREFDVLPYDGAFEDVVPHLTLAEGRTVRRLKHAAVRAARRLPQRCHAAEAWLLAESGTAEWRIVARFPLGDPVEAWNGSDPGRGRSLADLASVGPVATRYGTAVGGPNHV